MQRVIVAFVWIGVAAVLIGFVLPWVHIDVNEPGVLKQLKSTAVGQEAWNRLTGELGRVTATVRRGTETVTGTLPSLKDIPSEVSGVQVPQIANSQHAQIAVALFELFTGTRQDLGAKSYAVYGLPGLALLAGLLLTVIADRRVAFGVGLLCLAVAGFGFWKLMTTNTNNLLLTITIGEGLWLTFWAYAALGVLGLLRGVLRPAK